MYDPTAPPALPTPPTRFAVRRIRVMPALRTSVALGWVIALGPALAGAAVCAEMLRRAHLALAHIQPVDISILGQQIAHIDFLAVVGQQDNAHFIDTLAGRLPWTFTLFLAAFLLVGTLLVVATVLCFVLGYNSLAALTGGLEVELDPVSVEGSRRIGGN